jgi:hypothetical protein
VITANPPQLRSINKPNRNSSISNHYSSRGKMSKVLKTIAKVLTAIRSGGCGVSQVESPTCFNVLKCNVSSNKITVIQQRRDLLSKVTHLARQDILQCSHFLD